MEEHELQLLLEMLFEHKAEYIRDFLKCKELTSSGTKSDLRKRVETAIGGRISFEELVSLLNRIEGWGRQHIYLFLSPQYLQLQWQDEEFVKNRLLENNAIELLNSEIPIVMPEAKELSAVLWSRRRVRFVWITKREWEERVAERDQINEEEGIIWRAFKKRTGRGILALDWNLVNGLAMLMIQELPSGSKYDEERQQLTASLNPFINLEEFSPVEVSRAIQRIESSNEVRKRQIAHQTRQGGQAKFTSQGRSKDLNTDPDIQNSRRALGGSTRPNLGNFYWLPNNGQLNKEVHTVIYSDARRIKISGERTEQEVRYVIGRIYHYCQ